jgi:hypothetical protein
VKADKEKTSVIIYTGDYNKNVHDFLDNNNFHKLPKDPTNKYQKLISTNIKHCDLIIPKNHTKHLTQKKKPTHPSSRHRLKYINQETLLDPSSITGPHQHTRLQIN